ncbi:MAG: gephyrin-like molybdotransferase Glp [Rhizobiaceae bacterium]
MALLPVAEALAQLLEGAEPKPAEMVSLHDAAGRVLAEPLKALRTQPPFNASAMDGYAVRATDTTDAAKALKIIGEAPAGRQFSGKVGPCEAVRIFTGAPVPEGADAVLIQENAEAAGDHVRALEPVTAGRNIRRRGLDFKEGDVLLEKGRVLDAAALALAASANHPALPVVAKPIVAIIATGDELLLPGSTPGPDQIISSNAYGVAPICAEAGATVLDLGIARDSIDAITALVTKALEAKADIIVTLGGASVGDHDLVHQALTQAGMSLSFWKIAMRPGKPLMFGTLGQARCIGLPGNPVASLLCTQLFIRPLVRRLAGHADEMAQLQSAVLGTDMAENDLRQDYVRASVERSDGKLVATPFPTQDSSMLRVLADSNAAIVRPPFDRALKAGDACHVIMLR